MSRDSLPAFRRAGGGGQAGRVFRHREYIVEPETGPEAEPWTFFFECRVCGAAGWKKDSSDAAFGWALEHLKRNAGHLSYREHITRPYRAVPGRWL
jgi:hypothetical protein